MLLMHSPVHEFRSTALFVLVNKFQKQVRIGKEQIVSYYLANLDYVNNWDLVDACQQIRSRHYLFDKDRSPL